MGSISRRPRTTAQEFTAGKATHAAAPLKLTMVADSIVTPQELRGVQVLARPGFGVVDLEGSSRSSPAMLLDARPVDYPHGFFLGSSGNSVGELLLFLVSVVGFARIPSRGGSEFLANPTTSEPFFILPKLTCHHVPFLRIHDKVQ